MAGGIPPRKRFLPGSFYWELRSEFSVQWKDHRSGRCSGLPGHCFLAVRSAPGGHFPLSPEDAQKVNHICIVTPSFT